MKNRNGEDERVYFRTDRLYTIGNKYYFSSREGEEIGPFDTKESAALGLERYIACIVESGGTHQQAKQAALQGNWATTHYQ